MSRGTGESGRPGEEDGHLQQLVVGVGDLGVWADQKKGIEHVHHAVEGADADAREREVLNHIQRPLPDLEATLHAYAGIACQAIHPKEEFHQACGLAGEDHSRHGQSHQRQKPEQAPFTPHGQHPEAHSQPYKGAARLRQDKG